jgi:transposase-like protein
VGPADAALVGVSHPPDCPFCGAGAVERVGQWGGQMITAQWRCEACGSYFEAIREEFDDPAPGDEAPAHR